MTSLAEKYKDSVCDRLVQAGLDMKFRGYWGELMRWKSMRFCNRSSALGLAAS